MSRHRNVRAMNYNEEYDTYYDVYGQSVEDEMCISPRTAAEFMYDRDGKAHSMSAYLESEGGGNENLEDGESTESIEEKDTHRTRAESVTEYPENLSEVDEAKLRSCVEEMQNVVGETISEGMLIKAAIDNLYDLEKSLNAVLSQAFASEQAKPQRAKKERSVKTTIMEDANAKETLKPITEITTVVVQPEEDEKSSEACNFTTNNNANTNQLNPVKPNRAKSRSPSPANGGGDIEVENTTQSRRQRFSDTNPQEAYSKERLSGKPLINLVVIGHVDAGKSTLMGHLLYRLGCVTKKLMHKNEQDSKKLGKSSFMYAWVLDETPEERNRGITMDIAQSKFETKQRLVTLLDAPGHKDFIPNMITGAAQADVAILVVDATRGEFETGFEAGGQTREHAILVRSLGVSQLAVAVNKLDNVDWSKERYDEIVSKLTAFLKQAGYKEKDASFVPCSGLTGENLTELSKSCPLSSWYDGPCLVDVIDNFKPPERPVSKPFRMCISDIFKGMGAGFCVGGRVESGHIENGSKLLVLPAGEQATVKGIAIDEVSQSQAFAGDHVTLGLSGVDMNKVMVGDVVCDPHKPVKVSTRFRARIVVFNIDSPLTQGYPVVLHYQSMSEQAVIRKIITQLHKSTGEVVKKKPRFLLKNSSGLIEIEVVRPICVELYKDNRDLGRFMLRSCGTTVAAGLVTQVM